jgi:uncharacterized protein (TIGR02646 family)
MRRLDRSKVKAPANWQKRVAGAFADHAAYVAAAAEFERLPLSGTERRAGFIRYVQAKEIGCFAVPRNGKVAFRALWGEAKAQLQAMSSDKCSYCEVPIGSRREGQVEHFRPKSLFPALAYEWGNYLLGCGGCNGAKSDKWEARGYLRPDEGAPEKALRFLEDGTVEAVRGGRAAATIRDFDLNREELARLRETHIRAALESLTALLDEIEDAEVLRRLYGRYLANASGPGMVFSVALRQCLERVWRARRSVPSASATRVGSQ